MERRWINIQSINSYEYYEKLSPFSSKTEKKKKTDLLWMERCEWTHSQFTATTENSYYHEKQLLSPFSFQTFLWAWCWQWVMSMGQIIKSKTA